LIKSDQQNLYLSFVVQNFSRLPNLLCRQKLLACLKIVRKMFLFKLPANKTLKQNVRRRRDDTQDMYENTFPQISDHHFDKVAWPDEQEVAALVDND